MKGNSIKMAKQTSKKVKVVGTQQYINATDGTVEDFQVMRIEERDFNLCTNMLIMYKFADI